MSKKYIATVTFRAKPGKVEEIKQEIRRLVEETHKEPGCEVFTVLQSTEEPDLFILWEAFSSKEALHEHLDKEYTQRYFHLALAEPVSHVSLTEI